MTEEELHHKTIVEHAIAKRRGGSSDLCELDPHPNLNYLF
jgi:hypothetical protein